MKLIDSLKKIIEEVNIEIEKEKLKNIENYTNKIKKESQSISENTSSKNFSSFKEKYVRTRYSNNRPYSYSNKRNLKSNDIVKNDEGYYLKNFQTIDNRENNGKSSLSKELRKRNSARKSFIHSIIFERKI